MAVLDSLASNLFVAYSRKFMIIKFIANITIEEINCPYAPRKLFLLNIITYETIPNINMVVQIKNDENLMALVRR